MLFLEFLKRTQDNETASESLLVQLKCCDRGVASRQSTVEVRARWACPDTVCRGGPIYKVQIKANFVQPDFIMSHKSLDFGRVVLGAGPGALFGRFGWLSVRWSVW